MAASAPPSEVLGALRSTGLQALPVLDEDRRVVGWVSERDLVDRMYRDQRRAIAAAEAAVAERLSGTAS